MEKRGGKRGIGRVTIGVMKVLGEGMLGGKRRVKKEEEKKCRIENEKKRERWGLREE